MTRSLLCFAAASVLLVSCGPPPLVDEITEIQKGEWRFEDARRFSAEITDTLTPCNYYMLIRHGGDYAYQNLIVYFKTYYPDNTFTVDTIDCPMADQNGKWLGKGLGDLLDNPVLFKTNTQFRLSGTYNFEIQHAMRADTIHEIYDVGVRIESAID